MRTERAAAAARRRLHHVLGVIAAIDPSRIHGTHAPDTATIAARYAHRNALILSALGHAARAGLPAGIGVDPADTTHPIVVYIQLPTGQVSWHLPTHPQPFDGHTAQQKYHRIAAYARSQYQGDAQ